MNESWADVEALAGEVFRPEGVAIWMGAPNMMLGGRRPVECEPAKVHGSLLALAEGATG